MFLLHAVKGKWPEVWSGMQDARVFETPPPWSLEPPWTSLLHDESVGGAQRFQRIDIWHTVHMGFGKNWIACSVARIQYLTGGTSVDKRVDILNADFQEYCQVNKKTKYLSKLEASTFGLKFAEPSGSWNKAHITATLMGWLESFLEKHHTACESDEELRIIVASMYFSKLKLFLCVHVYVVISAFNFFMELFFKYNITIGFWFSDYRLYAIMLQGFAKLTGVCD